MKAILTTFLILIVLGFTAGCRQQIGQSDEEVKALVERAVELYNTGDTAFYDEFYTPDAVCHAVDIGDDVVGIEAAKDDFTSLITAYPDTRMTSDNLIVAGDYRVFQYTWTGTNTGPGDTPPTGKRVQSSGVVLQRIVDGKIAEEWGYYNQAAVLTQLGYTITAPPVEGEE